MTRRFLKQIEILNISQGEFQKKYDEDTKRYQDNFKKLEKNTAKKINNLQDEIRSIQIKSVEMLGVFVALFTFVSLDFSILKSSVNLGVSVSLILVAGGLLLTFLLLMQYMLFEKIESHFFSRTSLIWFIIISLLTTGIYFLKISLENYSPQEQERSEEGRGGVTP